MPKAAAGYGNGVGFATTLAVSQHEADRWKESDAITSLPDAAGFLPRNHVALLDAKLAAYPVAGRTVQIATPMVARMDELFAVDAEARRRVVDLTGSASGKSQASTG